MLDNAAGASWLALGSSDFGAGDDAIVNHGSIVLQDATIALGAYASGNAFDNSGVLAVSGVGGIDMGGAFAFVNNGTLSFVDGAADDSLTLVGTLAGSGTLNFDADLASQSGDRLHLDGDMAASAVQTINVNVVGGPVQAHERIELIATNGTLAGEFELGSLHDAGTDFLSQAFALSRSAQAVWLDADVVGLNDTGTLAANVASGAADMLNAQVGTFKQRMGVNPYGDDGKVLSAFFRTYTSEGDVEPTHVAANFGQGGNFAYDQSIWGREVGVNANLHGNFHAGITLGTADGRQRLTGNGVGQNRMDGMTWGWYATWFAPQGFYVDVSGRQMAVDVLSTSAAGQLQTRAHTGALNLEAGYQWTLGGLSVVPQLQYTRTEVEDVRAIHGQRIDFEGHGGTSSTWSGRCRDQQDLPVGRCPLDAVRLDQCDPGVRRRDDLCRGRQLLRQHRQRGHQRDGGTGPGRAEERLGLHHRRQLDRRWCLQEHARRPGDRSHRLVMHCAVPAAITPGPFPMTSEYPFKCRQGKPRTQVQARTAATSPNWKQDWTRSASRLPRQRRRMRRHRPVAASRRATSPSSRSTNPARAAWPGG